MESKYAQDRVIRDHMICDNCGNKIFDNMVKDAVFQNVKQRPDRLSVYCTRSCMLEDNRKDR